MEERFLWRRGASVDLNAGSVEFDGWAMVMSPYHGEPVAFFRTPGLADDYCREMNMMEGRPVAGRAALSEDPA